MSDETAVIVGAIVVIVIVIALIKGAIKTFQRNWIAALILLILLFPIWVIWAFIEVFTGEIVKESTQLAAPSQNVNVTVLNQSDGRSARIETNTDNEGTLRAPSLFADGTSEQNFLPKGNDVRPCPYCAEDIKATAVFCRFCQKDLA